MNKTDTVPSAIDLPVKWGEWSETSNYIRLFMNMFNKCLLSTYYVPKMFVSKKWGPAVNTAGTRPCLHGAYILMDVAIDLLVIRMRIRKEKHRATA